MAADKKRCGLCHWYSRFQGRVDKGQCNAPLPAALKHPVALREMEPWQGERCECYREKKNLGP